MREQGCCTLVRVGASDGEHAGDGVVMGQLPLVLAGPIVRRVEPRLVSVWVALREAATVTLDLWADTQVAAAAAGNVQSGDPTVGTGDTPTRRFGQHFHVAVATVELTAPTPPLTPGTIYSYDLRFSGAFGTSSLRGEGLLSDEPATPAGRLAGVDAAAPTHLALGYVQNRLPSFVAQAATTDAIRLAQASCRKTNGPGYDALAWLDDHLEATYTDVAERPQQLVLTGDQIYADDLGACLLPMLADLAADLLGATERLTVTDGAGGQVDATIANFPALFRQRLVREQAGFTSTSAHNHLLSFGEFAAMYLAVWSSRVWRPLADAAAVVQLPGNVPAAVGDHLTKWEECADEHETTFAAMHTPSFESERERVELFRSAVPKVARALANVATYMVCDDHEVTDDWNLNARWQQRVYTKPFGRQIVRNGVMAYAVFQGWGNDPAQYAKPDQANQPNHNRQLLEEIEKVFQGAGPYPAAAAQPGRLDELVGAASAPDRQPLFHVKVPGPRHLLVLLDTRTRRTFRGHGILPPKLLGTTLEHQVPADLTDGRELLIVVSAAPVLGPHLIDSIGQPVAQNIQDMKVGLVESTAGLPEPGPCEPSYDLGAEHFDAEGWAGDEAAFEAFLNRLAPHGRAVILSGDVHYGCTLALDHWRKGSNGTEPAPARIVQLTSSPARNNFKAAVEALLRSTAFLQRYQTDPKPERLAWSGKSSISIPDGTNVGPGRRARMNRSPALVPARGWPTGTTIPSDQPPDWRWRLSLRRDERPDSSRPTALRQPTLSTELDPNDPVPGYRRLAARHAQAAFTHFDHLRQMVFTNNIGLIGFATGADGALRVRHSMLSKDAPDSHLFGVNTVHDVSLGPTLDARPELVIRGS